MKLFSEVRTKFGIDPRPQKHFKIKEKFIAANIQAISNKLEGLGLKRGINFTINAQGRRTSTSDIRVSVTKADLTPSIEAAIKVLKLS